MNRIIIIELQRSDILFDCEIHLIMKSQLFCPEIFVDMHFKSIKYKELQCGMTPPIWVFANDCGLAYALYSWALC